VGQSVVDTVRIIQDGGSNVRSWRQPRGRADEQTVLPSPCEDSLMSVHAPPRRHRSVTRRLAVPVLMLALAALSIAGAWRLVGSTSGYSWDDDALVPIDGQGHVVPVAKNQLTMMWTYDFLKTPSCEVLDESGVALPLSAVSGDYRRDAGSAGDWVGTTTFTPTTDKVTVTCDGLTISGPPVEIPVTTAPTGATTPVERALRIGAAASLGVLAVLAVALAVAFGMQRRSSAEI
jgi:hypothetical protein